MFENNQLEIVLLVILIILATTGMILGIWKIVFHYKSKNEDTQEKLLTAQREADRLYQEKLAHENFMQNFMLAALSNGQKVPPNLLMTGTGDNAGRVDIEKYNFTKTEKMIVEEITKGLSNKLIADVLEKDERTLKNQITNIFQKAGVPSRACLIIKAKDEKWFN